MPQCEDVGRGSGPGSDLVPAEALAAVVAAIQRVRAAGGHGQVILTLRDGTVEHVDALPHVRYWPTLLPLDTPPE